MMTKTVRYEADEFMPSEALRKAVEDLQRSGSSVSRSGPDRAAAAPGPRGGVACPRRTAAWACDAHAGWVA